MQRCHMTLACWSVGVFPREEHEHPTGESPCSHVRRGESLRARAVDNGRLYRRLTRRSSALVVAMMGR
jgi:hypothetical protein